MNKPRPRKCACRCGKLTKGGQFLPGHDMRLKSKLLAGLASGRKAQREAAQRQAAAHGWKLQPA